MYSDFWYCIVSLLWYFVFGVYAKVTWRLPAEQQAALKKHRTDRLQELLIRAGRPIEDVSKLESPGCSRQSLSCSSSSQREPRWLIPAGLRRTPVESWLSKRENWSSFTEGMRMKEGKGGWKEGKGEKGSCEEAGEGTKYIFSDSYTCVKIWKVINALSSTILEKLGVLQGFERCAVEYIF